MHLLYLQRKRTIKLIILKFIFFTSFITSFHISFTEFISLNTPVENGRRIGTLYFMIIICASFFYKIQFIHKKDIDFLKSLRIIGFNFVSAITTTGFTSYNYITWGVWAPIVICALTLHGGCTGSTSGSIKIFRWQVVFGFLKKHTINALSPNQATVIKTGDKAVSNDIVASVFVLVMSFILAIFFKYF